MVLAEGRRKRASTGHGCGVGTSAAAGGPDRLSALPDCLLHEIMSFVKARQAVQTCVLSKRWRQLWRFAPCLDVDVGEFMSEKTAAALADDDSSGSSSGSISEYDSDSDDDGIADYDNGIADDPGNGIVLGDDHDSSESDDNTSSSSSSSDGNSGSDEDSTSSSSSDHQDDIYGSDSDYDSDHQDYEVNYASSASDDDDDSSDSDHDSSDSDHQDYEVNYASSASDDDDDSSDSDHDSIDGKEWVDFEDFAINLMLRCNMALLESFRLHTGSAPAYGKRQRQAGVWLRRAMRFPMPAPADPQSRRQGQSWGSGSWHLKRLHLSSVDLDHRFAEHVGSACHSLQDLELDNCTCRIHSLASESLKKLVLRKCGWEKLSEITCPTLETLVIEGGSNSQDRPVVILTPDVTYLRLAVYAPYFYGGISIGGEMPSLVKASIHLRCHRTSVFKSRFRGFQLDLLHSVSNATSLELSGVGIMAVSKEPTFHEFRNLRNLLLGNCDLSDRRTLRFFLHSSPNLEKLTLQHCKFSNDSDENEGIPKPNKFSSPVFHGLDFHRDNLKIEVIYKEEDACQLVEPLLHFVATNLSKNIKCFKVN